ncbi:hypothetical protein Nepgr_031282 [Nepenthes gracilis]|uniref:Uncharacterized protein n=1 Tax=Nepenthes gracilis TaxID=150966 RepID=A0AAD3THT4_NEPGR|nr:hypothetical protein Nepgr_031282 [Nepenthes gracilis]
MLDVEALKESSSPSDHSNGVGLAAPSEASEKNQRGIMPPDDCATEIHQLSAPDHVDESIRRDAVIPSSLLDASDQLPDDKAMDCSDDSGTPSSYVENISSLSDVFGREYYANGDSHEAVVVSLLGSLSSAGYNGEGYVVPEPKEQDEVKTISESDLLSPELLPAEPDASSFTSLDKAPIVKVVRFALEILSAEAPSSASHSRKMAPCSDICHPIVFSKSNRGQKGLVCRLLEDSQTPPDDALSSFDVLPIPSVDRLAAFGLSCCDSEESASTASKSSSKVESLWMQLKVYKASRLQPPALYSLSCSSHEDCNLVEAPSIPGAYRSCLSGCPRYLLFLA